MLRIEYFLQMMTSVITYHWGMGTPGPTHDRQRSQTVASTSSLLCGCERQSFRIVTIEHLMESIMLYNQQLLCK